jgi:hypothetical protein
MQFDPARFLAKAKILAPFARIFEQVCLPRPILSRK